MLLDHLKTPETEARERPGAEKGPYRAEFGAIHHEDAAGFLFAVSPPSFAEDVARALNLALLSKPEGEAGATPEGNDAAIARLTAKLDAEGEAGVGEDLEQLLVDLRRVRSVHVEGDFYRKTVERVLDLLPALSQSNRRLREALEPFAAKHGMGDNYVKFAPRLIEAARAALTEER